MIEQHVGHVFALCDRVAVLDHGSVAWVGPTSEATGPVESLLHAGTG